MRITETINIYDRELEVDLTVNIQREVKTLPNGDPGYPSMADVEIDEVYYQGRKYLHVLEKAEKMNLGVALIDVENKALEGYEY